MESFLRVLEYELRSSTRWRRYASVLVVGANGNKATIKRFRVLVGKIVRGTDEWGVLHDNSLVVLMPETNKQDAIRAIERYKEQYGYRLDVRYGAASYPEDSLTAGKLFEKARSRLKTAWDGEPGSVVMSDEA